MTAFSGVRSSWDMLARNSDLCRLATSSSADLVSSSRKSRALTMAIADCAARVSRRSVVLGGKVPGVGPAHEEHAPRASVRA